MFKKIISSALALAITLALSLCLFSCGGNEGGGEQGGNNSTTYTVTLIDQNLQPVVGAKVTLTTADGIPFFHTSDASGKVTLTGDYEGLTATVTSLPSGCSCDKLNVAQSFDSEGNLTVRVNQRSYVIKVVDQDGNPIADVTVSMCDSEGVCKLPTITDNNGKAFYPYEDGDFHAQLPDGAPEGYTEPEAGSDYMFEDGLAIIELIKN